MFIFFSFVPFVVNKYYFLEAIKIDLLVKNQSYFSCWKKTSERIEEGKLPSGIIFSEFPTTALTVSGSVGFLSVPLGDTCIIFSFAEHPNRILDEA